MKPPLWQCLRCGRRFANRNQWHSCSRQTVTDYIRGKSEAAIAVYRAFESAVRGCGPVRTHAAKTRIGFIARMTFANATVKRDRVEAGMYLPYRSPSARFHHFLAHGQGGMHTLWLNSVEEIDGEVRNWLSEAYALGMQETPPPLQVAAKARGNSSMRRKRRKLPSFDKAAGAVFYIHWNEEELRQMVGPLRAAGHDVRMHWSTTTTPKWGDYLPDLYVISLERRPSHGRGYAAWIREAKKRQGIPILFVGGDPAKVRTFRSQFPDALFCPVDQAPNVVAGLFKS